MIPKEVDSDKQFAIPAENSKKTISRDSKKASKKSRRKTPHINFDCTSNDNELQKQYYFHQLNLYKEFCHSSNDFYQKLLNGVLENFYNKTKSEKCPCFDKKIYDSFELSTMPKIIEAQKKEEYLAKNDATNLLEKFQSNIQPFLNATSMIKSDNAVAVDYLYLDSICTSMESSQNHKSSNDLRSGNSNDYNINSQKLFGTKRGPAHIPLPPKKMLKDGSLNEISFNVKSPDLTFSPKNSNQKKSSSNIIINSKEFNIDPNINFLKKKRDVKNLSSEINYEKQILTYANQSDNQVKEHFDNMKILFSENYFNEIKDFYNEKNCDLLSADDFVKVAEEKFEDKNLRKILLPECNTQVPKDNEFVINIDSFKNLSEHFEDIEKILKEERCKLKTLRIVLEDNNGNLQNCYKKMDKDFLGIETQNRKNNLYNKNFIEKLENSVKLHINEKEFLEVEFAKELEKKEMQILHFIEENKALIEELQEKNICKGQLNSTPNTSRNENQSSRLKSIINSSLNNKDNSNTFIQHETKTSQSPSPLNKTESTKKHTNIQTFQDKLNKITQQEKPNKDSDFIIVSQFHENSVSPTQDNFYSIESSKNSEKIETIINLKTQLDQLENEKNLCIKNMQVQLNKKEEEILFSDDLIKNYKEGFNDLRHDYELLNHQKVNLEQYQLNSDNEISCLKDFISKSQIKNQEIENNLIQVEAERTNLNDQLNNINQLVKSFTNDDSQSNLTKETNDMSFIIKSYINELKNSYHILLNEKSIWKITIDELEKNIHSIGMISEEHSSQANNRISSLQIEIDNKNELINEKETQLEKLTEEINEKGEMIDNLKAENNEYLSKLYSTDLINEKNSLDNLSYEELKKYNENLKNEIKSLHQMVENYTNENEYFKKQLILSDTNEPLQKSLVNINNESFEENDSKSASNNHPKSPENLNHDISHNKKASKNEQEMLINSDNKKTSFEQEFNNKEAFIALQKGWNEIMDEKQKIVVAREELDIWQDQLKYQGEQIDRVFTDLLDKENQAIKNSKLLKKKQEEIITLISQNDEKKKNYDKIEQDLLQKQDKIEVKTEELIEFWKFIESQKTELTESLQNLITSLTNFYKLLNSNFSLENVEKGLQYIDNYISQIKTYTENIGNADCGEALIDDTEKNLSKSISDKLIQTPRQNNLISFNEILNNHEASKKEGTNQDLVQRDTVFSQLSETELIDNTLLRDSKDNIIVTLKDEVKKLNEIIQEKNIDQENKTKDIKTYKTAFQNQPKNSNQDIQNEKSNIAQKSNSKRHQRNPSTSSFDNTFCHINESNKKEDNFMHINNDQDNSNLQLINANYNENQDNDEELYLDISNNKIILNEDEYNALVSENQEFQELLNVAKDQFNSLQEKHIYLVECINNSQKSDSNKIMVKLDKCFKFMNKSMDLQTEFENDRVSVLRISEPSLNKKESNTTQENNSFINIANYKQKELNGVLKKNIKNILDEKNILETRLKILESYINNLQINLPNINEYVDYFDEKSIKKHAEEFYIQNKKITPNEKNVGIDLKNNNNSGSIIVSENNSNYEYNEMNLGSNKKRSDTSSENLNTQIIYSDVIDVGLDGQEANFQNSNEEEDSNKKNDDLDISTEKLVELLLLILGVLDNIRQICLNDIYDLEKVQKIGQEVHNLEFIEIDEEGKIDLTAAVVNQTKQGQQINRLSNQIIIEQQNEEEEPLPRTVTNPSSIKPLTKDDPTMYNDEFIVNNSQKNSLQEENQTPSNLLKNNTSSQKNINTTQSGSNSNKNNSKNLQTERTVSNNMTYNEDFIDKEALYDNLQRAFMLLDEKEKMLEDNLKEIHEKDVQLSQNLKEIHQKDLQVSTNLVKISELSDYLSLEKSKNHEKNKIIKSLEHQINNLSKQFKSLEKKNKEFIIKIHEQENVNVEASKPLLQDQEILCEENDQLKSKLIEIKTKFEIREKEILHDFDQLSKAFQEAKKSNSVFEPVDKTNYKKHQNLTPDPLFDRNDSKSSKERKLRHKVSQSSRSQQGNSHYNTKDDKVTVRKLVQVSMLESEVRDKDIMIEKLMNNIKKQSNTINNLEKERDQLFFNNTHLMQRSSYRQSSYHKPGSSVKTSNDRSSNHNHLVNLSDRIVATNNTHERQRLNMSFNYLTNKTKYEKRCQTYGGEEDSNSEDVEEVRHKFNQSLKNMTDFIQNPKPKSKNTRKSMPLALEMSYDKDLKMSESWNENEQDTNFLKEIKNSGKGSLYTNSFQTKKDLNKLKG